MSSTTPNDGIGNPLAHMSIWHRLYTGKTNFEFVRRWKRWAVISLTVIVIGLVALIPAVRGLKLGIDFKGGTVWELPAKNMTEGKARSAVGSNDVRIQFVGNDRISIRGAKTDTEQRNIITEKLRKAAGLKSVNDVSVTFVGPSWGKDVSHKALLALFWFFIVIAIYISFQFEWKMAIAALVAVVHDILVTVGVYSISGFEVSPATVIAFLTILGFSLYDTIVVFDKVADNEKTFAPTGRLVYTDVVNVSMNQVLMRSINTSLVAILPVLSMLILGVGVLGATALRDFALALLIGLLTGAYSSIFVASPLLAILKEREEKWAAIRNRLSNREGGEISEETGAAARVAALAGYIVGGTRASEGDGTILVPGVGAVFPGQTPRGRKQGRVR
jgi:preprotein translocase subunit SecF